MKLRKTLKLLYWLLFKDGIQETLDSIRIYKEAMYGAKIGVQENYNSISHIQYQLNMEQNVVAPKVVDYIVKKIDRDKEDRITDSRLIRDSIIDLRKTTTHLCTTNDKRLYDLKETWLVEHKKRLDVIELALKDSSIPLRGPDPKDFF